MGNHIHPEYASSVRYKIDLYKSKITLRLVRKEDMIIETFEKENPMSHNAQHRSIH